MGDGAGRAGLESIIFSKRLEDPGGSSTIKFVGGRSDRPTSRDHGETNLSSSSDLEGGCSSSRTGTNLESESLY